MAPCPDCDAIKIFSDPPQGDGKCSACHGTGFGEFFDTSVLEFVNTEQPACEECYGTGQCQTCRGSGMIEDYESKTAA